MEIALVYLLVATISVVTASINLSDCPRRCQCVSTTIHCNARGLRRFPGTLPRNAVTLLIEENRISSVSFMLIFNNLNTLKHSILFNLNRFQISSQLPPLNSTHLHTVILQNNKIYNLQLKVFRAARNINFLNLANNRLRVIRNGVLSQLSGLALLNLGHNNITRIFAGAFAGLSHLSDLYLHNNRITSIPQGLFTSLVNLKQLRLDQNRIVRLTDDTFLRQTFLISLNLANNNLRRITSATMRGMASLQKLLLSGNQIQSLDSNINPPDTDCAKLTNVSQEVPRDRTVRPCFYYNKNLQYIDLSNNSLSTVRLLTFSRLRMLSKLSLDNNQWRCDCFLVWSLLQLQRLHDDKLAMGAMRCWEPAGLDGVPIDQFTEHDLAVLPGQPPPRVVKSGLFVVSNETTRQGTVIEQRHTPIEDIYRSHATNNPTRTVNTSPSSELAGKSKLHLTTTSTMLPGLASVAELAVVSTEWRPTAKRLPLDMALQPATEQAVGARLDDAHAGTHVTKASNPRPGIHSKTEIERDVRVNDESPTQKSRFSEQDMNDDTDSFNVPSYGDETVYRTRQDGVMSWLPVAGMFSLVFIVSICGAMVLKWQFNPQSEKCSCCTGHRDVSRQHTSESIRSISNYPLLYDNPLARRPLPRQPIMSTSEQARAVMNDHSGRVDVRWTNGGSFGLGYDSNGVKGRLTSKSATESGSPPMIPPRDPMNARSWDDKFTDRNRRTAGTPNHRLSASYPSNAIWNPDSGKRQLRQTLSVDDAPCKISEQCLNLGNGFIDVCDDEDDARLERIHSEKIRSGPKKKSSRRKRRNRPESMICAESSNPAKRLSNNSERKAPCASAPVSRHNSNISTATYRVSKRGKRDRVAEQMLEALQEIEIARRNSNATELNGGPHLNKCAEQKFTRPGIENIIHSQDINSKEIGMLNSAGPRRLSRGASARFAREKQHKQSLDSFCPNSRPAERCNCSRHCRSRSFRSRSALHISDVDFEFPPPPPCALVRHTEDAQASSMEPSGTSDQESDVAENGSYNNDYSMLSMCTSGIVEKDSTHEKECKKESTRVLEEQYRSTSKHNSMYRRKDSTDSMFVGIDSAPETRSLSDSDNESTQFSANTHEDTRKNREPLSVCRVEKSLAGNEYRFADGAANEKNYLYAGNNFLLGSNRLSRLDLSLSESSSECSVAADVRSSEIVRSRSSSVGSTVTIKPTVDNSTNTQQAKVSGKVVTKQSTTDSDGSESASSFEMCLTMHDFKPETFIQNETTNEEQEESTYQSLHLMYSGHLPETEENNIKSVISESNSSIDTTSSNSKVEAMITEAMVGKKRCYFDVVESSADDVSTDIEMFDLGTM
uniref:uncharacterized protein LOC100176386 isoform X2 n=1 Tax=Ciona intestinalis TaxID=7719 RepID=UPI000EF4BA34|nr:uncharacterized protein LOC100176386 isoform X2 [Ciona intestinalis]|eukprot:XP_002122405.3 uncharacterized protein LOC100176386 isoform X2 [Ciona intestinalis]